MKKVILFGVSVVFTIGYLVAQRSDQWTYIEIDSQKPKWGDFAEPEWLRYFGMDAGDIDGDGQNDIVSGRSVYLNPGSQMADWEKLDLGINADGILIMDVDGDPYQDIIAQALPKVYWIEFKSKTQWEIKEIGTVPATSHVNSQGFTKGQIIPGDKEEFVIAGNGNIYLFQVPANPGDTDWNVTLIGANTSDEGIGLGDMDGDGDLDMAAGRRPAGEEEPKIVVWFENPGSGTIPWQAREIGTTDNPADRFGIADFDQDGMADILICEERWPGEEPDGNIYLFKRLNSGSEWDRQLITTQFSSNNLDIADLNLDGTVDFVTSEHKGTVLELQFWINDGKGEFTKEVLDTGKESHLGTQLRDIDGDGDLDIISAGWDQHQFVHLWLNNKK